MIRYFFLLLLVSLIALVAYLFFYLGLYKSADVRRESRGPLQLLFISHIGAYHEIGPTIREVELWAQAHHVDCAKTFGEYLDDPQAMDQDRLRSRGGCVVNAKPSAPLDPGLEYVEYPAGDYVVGRFSVSPAVGPWKVYPKIKQFMFDQRFRTSAGAIEIYSVHGDAVDTEYLFRLDASQP